MVDLQYVDSSNVEAIGYDPDAMELHVLFKSGPTIYVYLNVPQDVFDSLQFADSKGQFINREVKPLYDFDKR